MAVIHEEVLVIKVSKLVRDAADAPRLVTAETVSALEQVAQELVGEGVIVEVEQAN